MTKAKYNFNDYPVEGPMNEDKLPVMVVADVSGSMAHAIDDLNQSINHFIKRLREDEKAAELIDLCIIAFNDEPKLVQPWTMAKYAEEVNLSASGGTNMDAALVMAEEYMTGRGRQYTNSGIAVRMPQMIVLSDGYGGDITAIADKIQQRVRESKLHVWALCVPGYHEESIAQLTQGIRCMELHGTTAGFTEAFDYLGLAYKAVSLSAPGEKVHVEHTFGDVEKGSAWHKPDLDEWLRQ